MMSRVNSQSASTCLSSFSRLVVLLLLTGCSAPSAKDLEDAPQDPPPELDDSSHRTGNIIVLTSFDSAEASSPESSRETRSCRTRVWLRDVYYGGDDVGDDWEYVVSVDASNWVSGRRKLSPGEVDRLDRRVHDVTRAECGRARSISVTVRAREFDPVLDETADEFGFALLPCEKEPTRTTFQVLVPVTETPSFLEPRATAALVFAFQCETQCVE